MTIKNKVVAITGAGRGIGRATAIHLAARGASLVLGARSEAEIAAVADEIQAEGGRAAYRPTDVTQRGELVDLVNLACEQFVSIRRRPQRGAIRRRLRAELWTNSTAAGRRVG